jgi:hypothetical protein
MPAQSRDPLPCSLHALMTLILVVCLLARPLLVAACDVEDSRRASGSVQVTVADSVPLAAAGGDCCITAMCGECCGYVPLGTPAKTRVAADIPMFPQTLPEQPGRFEAVAYPVDSRPPIDV